MLLITHDFDEDIAMSDRVVNVSPVVLANALYLPSVTSCAFSSLHTSVGLALVGAVEGK